MQAVSSTSFGVEEAEEGFEQSPTYSEEVVVERYGEEGSLLAFSSLVPSGSKTKSRFFSQQKPTLKFRALAPSSKYIKRSGGFNTYRYKQEEESLEREEECRSDMIAPRKHQKLLQNSPNRELQNAIETSLIKSKRSSIAENLSLNNDELQQQTCIAQELAVIPQAEVAYKQKIPDSTFGYFRRLLKHSQQSSFLSSKLNKVLRVKMQKGKSSKEDEHYSEKPKKRQGIEFSGDFESGNLDFALKIAERQYNVFLRIDTNTRGHQSWFYFQVNNWLPTATTIRINICNVKRRFKMIEKGQKIHYRDLSSQQDWQMLEEEVEVQPYGINKFKISFDLQLQSQQTVLLSLIPPYTYSRLLKDIETFEQSPNVRVEVLTHSITGLAVPLLTVTKGAAKEKKSKAGVKSKKKMMLLSGRVHPSETCSSFILSGLIHELLQSEDYDQFLSNNILKIVPMLNPDGVVFGNFRTNYLGDDLNRSFHKTDDAVYPETTALKELGKAYKEQYGDNFVGFIDLHGHSSQTNSFVYGPEYEENSDSFVECRILPKIIDRVSKYFKYEMSNFRLPNYKTNTARGYFLRRLKVPSYTIETSYALYQDKANMEGSPKTMSIAEWTHYGSEIARSIALYWQYLEVVKMKLQIFRTPKQRKSTIIPRKEKRNATCIDFGGLRKQIEKETRRSKEKGGKDESSDSDGEDQTEDLPEAERQAIIVKLREKTVPSFLLPKLSKPSIVLPSVVPAMVNLSKDDKNTSTMPRLANKFRQKKLVRPLNLSYQYTQYLLKNISDIGSLRPEVLQFSSGKHHGLEAVLKKNNVIDL